MILASLLTFLYLVYFYFANKYLSGALLYAVRLWLFFRFFSECLLGITFPVYITKIFVEDSFDFSRLNNYFLFHIFSQLFLLIIFVLIIKKKKKIKNGLQKNHEKYQDIISINKKASTTMILFCTLIALFWIIITNGEALISPREAYQFSRKGFGWLWAMGCFSTSITLVQLIASNTLSVRKSIYIIILTLIYGNKSFTLFSFITIIFSKPSYLTFIKSRLRTFVFKNKYKLLMGCSILAIFILYLQFGRFTQGFSMLIDYFKGLEFAAMAIQDKLLGKVDFNSSLYWSNFWVYFPRVLFPMKPLIYGNTILVDHYFPGIVEIGHTPSFGSGTNELLSFGYLGIIPYSLKIENILCLLAIFCLKRKEIINDGFTLYLYGLLIFNAGINFHFPWFAGITLSYFLYKLKISKSLD